MKAAVIILLAVANVLAASTVTLAWDKNPAGQWVTNYYVAALDAGPAPESPDSWPVFKAVGNTNRTSIELPDGFMPTYYGAWAENQTGLSGPAVISAADPAGPVGSLRIIEIRDDGVREFGFTNLPAQGSVDVSTNLTDWSRWIDYTLTGTNVNGLSWRVNVNQAPQLFWRLIDKDQ